MRGGQKTKTSCGAASKIYYERQLSCLSLGIPVVAAMSSYGLPSAGPSGQEHRSSFRALRSRARIRSLASWGDSRGICLVSWMLAWASARYLSQEDYRLLCGRSASSCVLGGRLLHSRSALSCILGARLFCGCGASSCVFVWASARYPSPESQSLRGRGASSCVLHARRLLDIPLSHIICSAAMAHQLGSCAFAWTSARYLSRECYHLLGRGASSVSWVLAWAPARRRRHGERDIVCSATTHGLLGHDAWSVSCVLAWASRRWRRRGERDIVCEISLSRGISSARPRRSVLCLGRSHASARFRHRHDGRRIVLCLGCSPSARYPSRESYRLLGASSYVLGARMRLLGVDIVRVKEAEREGRGLLGHGASSCVSCASARCRHRHDESYHLLRCRGAWSCV